MAPKIMTLATDRFDAVAIRGRGANSRTMTGRLPSLRGIETFVCVAELLNLRLASERLNVTVSAISHRIHVLEDELGLLLFHRGGRQLKLTDDGEALLERVLPGISLIREATSTAGGVVTQPLLRVAAPPVFHDCWLVPRLGEFLAERPGTRVELISSGRRRSAATDVAVVPLTASTLREGARPLIEIEVAPVCSPEFLGRHPVRVPSDLLSLPLIDTIPSVRSWQNWFEAAGVEDPAPPPALALDNLALLYNAAEQGLGVALGSRLLVADLVAQGRLVEPLAVSCTSPPSLGILVNSRGNIRLARAFAAWLSSSLGASVENSSTAGPESETSR